MSETEMKQHPDKITIKICRNMAMQEGLDPDGADSDGFPNWEFYVDEVNTSIAKWVEEIINQKDCEIARLKALLNTRAEPTPDPRDEKIARYEEALRDIQEAAKRQIQPYCEERAKQALAEKE